MREDRIDNIEEEEEIQYHREKGVESGKTFTEAEGKPRHLDVNGKFLAVGTSGGRIKVYDVSRGREPKEVGSGGSFEVRETGEPIGAIRSIKVNSDGTRVNYRRAQGPVFQAGAKRNGAPVCCGLHSRAPSLDRPVDPNGPQLL